MDRDTRWSARQLLGRVARSVPGAMARTAGCALAALLVSQLPLWLNAELGSAGRIELGILVFAALLWMTEAIPAFAVALAVIGLQIALLGEPGGPLVAVDDPEGWRIFVTPWSSPMMWLFLGGFVLAHGCMKTGLDRWMAGLLLSRLSGGITGLLAGVMAITFVLSMFMSNTATAAMMLAVIGGLLRNLPGDDLRAKALLLGIAVAANVGGMGTLIGSPPNAIAAAELVGRSRVGFLEWMGFGLPPALILAGAAFGYLWWGFLRGQPDPGFHLEATDPATTAGGPRFLVMGVFFVTVLLWMSEALHGIPTPVISFLPIVALAVGGVMTSTDVRQLPWDVLILLAGGLSLGVGVEATGLAAWLVSHVPADLGAMEITLALVALAIVLSNLMSNTATASLLIPLAAGLAASSGAGALVVSAALASSIGMSLPISTPPNAIAFSSGQLAAKDFLVVGLLMSAIGAVVLVLWTRLLSGG